jgi:hypothetical protein
VEVADAEPVGVPERDVLPEVEEAGEVVGRVVAPVEVLGVDEVVVAPELEVWPAVVREVFDPVEVGPPD